MSRVFILERTKLDTSSAAQYGRIEYVFEHDTRRSSIWSDEFLDEIVERLREMNFDNRNDYFVVIGNMIPVLLAALNIVKHYGEIRLLLYSSHTRQYVEKAFIG